MSSYRSSGAGLSLDMAAPMPNKSQQRRRVGGTTRSTNYVSQNQHIRKKAYEWGALDTVLGNMRPQPEKGHSTHAQPTNPPTANRVATRIQEEGDEQHSARQAVDAKPPTRTHTKERT